MISLEQNSFIETLVANASPSLKGWLRRDKLAENYGHYVEKQMNWLSDADFAKSFCHSCAALKKEPRAFLNRLIELDGNRQFIAGIRFLGMDLNKPFVDVLPNFAIERKSTLRKIRAKVISVFTDFAPRALRLFVNNEADLPMWQKLGASVDLYYVASSFGDLRHKGPPSSSAQVSVERAQHLDFYEEYLTIFERFHRQKSELAIHVTPESRDDLRECMDDGGLFFIKVKDQWAGVLAVQKAREYGFSGYLIREEILKEEYRGKRLAPKALELLIRALVAEDNDLLFGTIHPLNIPSLKTARAVGREVTSAFVFVNLTSSSFG